MIKATELRIGNKLISGTSVGYYTVCMIEEFGTICFAEMDGHSYDLEDNDIRPVTLAPEILEKCGFIDPAGEGWGRRLYLNDRHELAWYLQDQQMYGESHVKYQTRGSGFSHDFGVKYLHQLQNLYFALTGEELNCQL